MHHTPAVVEALQLIARRGEALRYPFVGDHDAAFFSEHVARCPQRFDGMVHVVQGLEDRDQVVAAAQLCVAGVLEDRPHTAAEAGSGDAGAGSLDRGGIDVRAGRKLGRIRVAAVRAYAAEAAFGRVDVLPIEHDFWRFYRLMP